MKKIIILLLLFLIQIAWANERCDTNTDVLWDKLDKQYRNSQEGYIDYRGGFSCLKMRREKNKAVLSGLYCKSLGNEKEESLCSMVVAVCDLNKSIIEQSYFHVDNLKIIPSKVSFELWEDYPDRIDVYKAFGLCVRRQFYGEEEVESRLFLYEKNEEALKPLLSNFLVEKIYQPYDEGMKEELSSTEWILVHREGRKMYGSLEFSPYYTYKSDKEWKVNLSNVKLVYKNGKYEVVSKAKALFDLKEVESNTKKGLRYKKIVLESMLFEVPLTHNNENSYRRIMYNLYENGHKKQGDFLHEILKPLESWEYQCSYDADWFSLELEKKHKHELIDYERLVVFKTQRSRAFCSKENESNEAVIIRPYGKIGKKKGTLSLLISVIDIKNNEIKESYFHKNAMDFSYLSIFYKLDRESYSKISNNEAFSIAIQEMLDGPPTDTKTHLFIYERKNGTLRPILSDLIVEESCQEMGSQHKSQVATFEKFQMSIDYPPLLYKQNYSYYYEAEGYKGEHDWKVTLEDIVCSYEKGKYKCKQKPIFNLEQIAKNVEKGLKYKEIVLRAMLWETKVSEKNLKYAQKIIDYFTEHKEHLKIAEILEHRVDSTMARKNIIMNPSIKVKKKSWLYKKADINSQSKKFLIKDDVALILKRKEGWYKIYFYHLKWNTKTTLWIRAEDVEEIK